MPPRQELPPTPLGHQISAASEATRYLFRLTYHGTGRDGTVRVALALWDDGRYSLRASDPLGRALWSADVESGQMLMVDHRAETYCRTEDRVELPELRLHGLPAKAIPAVLLGYLPVRVGQVEPASAQGGETQGGDAEGGEFLDNAGRRWRYRTEEGRLATWTLYEGETPLLWWSSQQQGGILSHRQGEQYRWRRVVRESLDSPDRIQVPAEYDEGACFAADVSQLRKDQPPPPGGRAT